MGARENVIPLSECVQGAVYEIKANNKTFVGVYDGAHRFIHLIDGLYHNYDLIADLHVESDIGVGGCRPIRLLEQIPSDIPVSSNLGLHCQICDEPVSAEWKHSKPFVVSHKVIAVWKRNEELINHLLEISLDQD